ncbi:MAG: ABC transporter permease [Planctomycetes bacterium]|nr:ABC transporter permease [Planctomycetota bacterium]
MTIFGTGYREISFVPEPTWRRIAPLAWAEFRLLLRTRLGLLLFLGCQFPALQGLAILMIRAGIWQLGGPSGTGRERVLDQLGASPTSAAFYVDPAFGAAGTFLVALTLTTVVASRAIARDRETQALELLWTRGVTPIGYFLGKWLGSFLLLGVGAVAAPLVLYAFAWSIADEPDFLAQTIGFLPRLVAGLAFFTAAVSGLAVAFSSLFRSPNVASMCWVLVLFGADRAAAAFERLVRGESWLRAVSPWDAIRRVAEALVGLTPRVGAPLEVALAVVAALGLGLGVAVVRRLRTTEAVG